MKIMSVDLGLARTGLATGDSGSTFAFPKTVINEYNEQRLVEKICVAAKQECAQRIVVGLPKNMDGSEGDRAQKCREIAQKIGECSGIETVMWDERCTTVSAHATLSANNVRGKKRKERVDAVAAVIILEDYLRFLNN